MGPGVVMRHDSFVDFGAVKSVRLFVYLPSFLAFLLSLFLILTSLLICFLTRLLPDLTIYFQSRPVPFSGQRL